MKTHPLPQAAVTATLQTVLGRLATDDSLSDIRKRDLRSAVVSFAKLTEQSPAAIPLDVTHIRRTLDGIVPARAKISPKRWANLRSDLTAAIRASGLRPMFKTADLDLDQAWSSVLASANRQVRHDLSRFARWASLRRIQPEAVDNSTFYRFVAEVGDTTLVRNLHHPPGTIARTGMPSWRSRRRLVCAVLPCQPLGLRRPEFLGRSFRHRSEKTSTISSPGRRAPIRCRRELGQRSSPHSPCDCDESIFIPP